MSNIKIILADDHKIFLDGMISMLSDVENFEIVATANSGEQLLFLVDTIQCDLIISDITMKGINGLEATKIIKKEHPKLKVLILSMHSNYEFILNSVKVGADGYLPKDTTIKELIKAINKIHNGGQYFSKEITEQFFNNYTQQYRNEQNLLEQEDLTAREIEILKLTATGLSNKEIANQLFISVKTVDTHKNHIMQKLKLKNSAQLVLFAVKNKLIEP